MEKMEKFTHPIELSDHDLDLVAAGSGGCCRGGTTNNTNNGGIGGLLGIGFLNDNNFAVQVGLGNVAVQNT